MDNGIAFAEQFDLMPGVRLSEAQMAALTTDIVWLETETVTLRDGSTHDVLVPKVYALVQDGDLNGSGALLSGRSVNLQSYNRGQTTVLNNFMGLNRAVAMPRETTGKQQGTDHGFTPIDQW